MKRTSGEGESEMLTRVFPDGGGDGSARMRFWGRRLDCEVPLTRRLYRFCGRVRDKAQVPLRCGYSMNCPPELEDTSTMMCFEPMSTKCIMYGLGASVALPVKAVPLAPGSAYQ